MKRFLSFLLQKVLSAKYIVSQLLSLINIISELKNLNFEDLPINKNAWTSRNRIWKTFYCFQNIPFFLRWIEIYIFTYKVATFFDIWFLWFLLYSDRVGAWQTRNVNTPRWCAPATTSTTACTPTTSGANPINKVQSWKDLPYILAYKSTRV